MATKHFQARTEEVIQQLLRDLKSKSTFKGHPQCRENVERLLQRAKFGRKLQSFQDLNKTDLAR